MSPCFAGWSRRTMADGGGWKASAAAGEVAKPGQRRRLARTGSVACAQRPDGRRRRSRIPGWQTGPRLVSSRFAPIHSTPGPRDPLALGSLCVRNGACFRLIRYWAIPRQDRREYRYATLSPCPRWSAVFNGAVRFRRGAMAGAACPTPGETRLISSGNWC